MNHNRLVARRQTGPKKKVVSLSLDEDIINLIGENENQSRFVNNILRQYYNSTGNTILLENPIAIQLPTDLIPILELYVKSHFGPDISSVITSIVAHYIYDRHEKDQKLEKFVDMLSSIQNNIRERAPFLQK